MKYTIIIKTAEAEIRAIEELEEKDRKELFPIIEITRGRKVNNREGLISYPFDKLLSRIIKAFSFADSSNNVFIDLTADPSLFSPEIDDLYDPRDGYDNWINFLLDLRHKAKCNIIPTLILNGDDEDFYSNIREQINKLKNVCGFSEILYRNSIIDEGCYQDFEEIKETLSGIKVHFLIDCGYIPSAAYQSFAEKAIVRFSNIDNILYHNELEREYIICGTSFPNNISELGGQEEDTFSLSEVKTHRFVQQNFEESDIDISVDYGDYGSINPIRNDTILMARGWIPRIDIPLSDTIFYYRQRRPRGESAYRKTYIEVAQKVVNDNRFPRELNCWGVDSILKCAEIAPPGSTPQFWISVRMNIHIKQQIKRLSLM